MMRKFLSFFVFTTLISNIYSQNDCSTKLSSIELITQKLLFLNDNFLKNEKIYDDLCDTGRTFGKEVKVYLKSSCADNFSKIILKSVLIKSAKFVKELCDKNREKQVKLVDCAAKKNSKKIKTCFAKMANSFTYISEKVTDSQRIINLLCCSYHHTVNCIEKTNFNECDGTKIDYFGLNLLNTLVGDYLGLVCGRFTKPECIKDKNFALLDSLPKMKNPTVLKSSLKLTNNIALD